MIPSTLLPAETIRTCVACRTRRPQRDLIRVNQEGDALVLVATPNRRIRTPRGRSVYICSEPACVDRVKPNALARTLRTPLDLASWGALQTQIECLPEYPLLP